MAFKKVDVSNEVTEATLTIDENIAAYLRRNNLRQGELAPLIGLSEAQFSRKRRGAYPWKMSELIRIGSVLDKSLKELTGF